MVKTTLRLAVVFNQSSLLQSVQKGAEKMSLTSLQYQQPPANKRQDGSMLPHCHQILTLPSECHSIN